MNRSELTREDRDLLRQAIDASDRLYIKDFQEVAGALRTSKGAVFTGIHFETKVGFATICGEVAAICCMVSAGHRDLETIVAVWHGPEGRHCILPPCGRCREVIREFNPSAWVILSSEADHWQPDAIGRPCKVRIGDLLPIPYR